MSQLLYPPQANAIQKTLNTGLNQGVTASLTLNNTTYVDNKPGVIVIDRIDTNGTEKSASEREYIEYTGVSGSTLTGLTRGVSNSTDQDHATGAVVEFIVDVTWGTRVAEALATVVTDADHEAVNTTNIVTPTATQTLTNKTLTSPVITTPQINDTTADHQYIFASSELTADRTVTLPLLTGNDDFVFEDHSQTLTNKRINPRTTTEVSSATPTINTDNTDIHTITALATAITSMTTNLSGTPVNGQKLIIRIKDDGTARAITWGASFASRGATLPTTTVLSKYQYNGFIYNSTASVWDCVASINEA